MDLKSIANNSAYFTDEKFSDIELLSFANKAISRINIECKTYFKDFETMSDKYIAIPKKWLLSLISPYLSYGIKMNDTSLTEAQMYLEEFYSALKKFQEELGTLIEIYTKGDTENGVSPEFASSDGFGGAYGIDTSGAINKGWFGNNSNGGCF